MSTYSATVQLANGTLTVGRPYPAPQAVDSLVDQLVYALRDAEDTSITSIGVTIVTDETATTAPIPDPPPAEALPSSPDSGAAPDPLAEKPAKG